MKILIIEDEKELSVSMVEFLQSESYLCETAYDYDSAWERLSLYQYDCILLDITLPGGNGLQLLKKLKKLDTSVGVIIISARNSIDDRVTGLEIGADDYLPKPFHLAELGARVKALIRRNKFDGADVARFENLTVDFGARAASVNNKTLDLTRSELDLLFFLVANKNKVVSKNAIGEHLSGDDADRMDNYDFVYSHIKNLKRKLAEAGCEDFIKTVYKLGYKFEG
ncbi:MAG TPA: response regulator transcription factor [Cyclobacteriaceae bacterium]|nr:response regulator transcription factor [Cyclobacteriaceae bacterium]